MAANFNLKTSQRMYALGYFPFYILFLLGLGFLVGVATYPPSPPDNVIATLLGALLELSGILYLLYYLRALSRNGPIHF